MKRAITVILSILLIFSAFPALTFAGDNFLETLSPSSAIDGLLNTNKEAPAAPEEEPATPKLPFTNPFSQIIDQLNSNNAAPKNDAAAPAEPETAAPEPETEAPAPEPETTEEDYKLDKMADLLVCLGGKPYVDTMLPFINGETVSFGDNSELAAGLQQTLVDLGCEIAVDGSAGPGTFGALNSLLKSTGLQMEDIDTVNDEVYWDLLAIWLIENQEEDAYNMISRYFEVTENTDQLQYIKAGLYFYQQRYYSAMMAFYDSHYDDWEERLAACEQPWPSTGELWHNDAYYSSQMSLTFDVNWDNSSEGHYYMVFANDGTLVSQIFVSGTGTASAFLLGGTYKIRSAVGDTWYGPKEAFGELGYYDFLRFEEDPDDPYLTYLDAGYDWTISINAVDYNPDASSIGALDSNWEDWILP